MTRPEEAMSEGPEIVVGRKSDDRVVIRPHLETAASGGDPWSTSINAAIEIRAGAFQGSLSGNFQAGDFSSFLAELEQLRAAADSKARLICSDNWLTLELQGDRLGHISVRGQARDYRGQELTFEIRPEVDQSFLPEIRSSLKKLLEHFGIRVSRSRTDSEG
jgi:hypothetical protein